MKLTLVEKYRPKDWCDVQGNEKIVEVLKRNIENDQVQDMIFAGPPGTGKTTIGRIFASKYLGKDVDFKSDHDDYRELNASDERGIDVIRGKKVKTFASTPSNTPGKKRVLYLIEADKLTNDAQTALRAIMENNQETCLFILDMNHIEQITEKALLSRCQTFKFDPQPESVIYEWVKSVAEKEGLKFESDQLLRDIAGFKEYEGDLRRVLNDTLQKLVGINKTITKEDISWIYKESYEDLVGKIIQNRKQAISIYFNEYKTRAIDPVNFTRSLFDKFSKLAKVPISLVKIFASVDKRLRNGADDLIQLSYLLTAFEASE
jgi:replication factor C small subunit